MKNLFVFLIVFNALSCGIVSGCTEPKYIQPDEPKTENPNPDPDPDPDPDNNVDPAPVTKYNSFKIVGVDHFGRSFGTVSAFKKDRQV
ncbi:MAG: hypothetical protein LBB90_07555, partial [Tannerella sp.]|nr:hypothetical protein [Tannerella sp.]